MQRAENRRFPWFLLAVCVLIGAVVLFYSLAKGNYYYVDEVWTFGYSNSYYAPDLEDLRDGDLIGKTLTRQDFHDFVTVGADDAFAFDSVSANVVSDIHPPLYHWMIHLICSCLPGVMSKWIGLVPNYLFFAATLLLLYRLARSLLGSRNLAALTLLLYGLSTVALCTVLMIRMYAMKTFFAVLLAYLAQRLLRQARPWHYPAFLLTVAGGLLTQYLFVFYAFFLCAAVVFVLLHRREYRRCALFAGFALGGAMLVLLLFLPGILAAMSRRGGLHPSKADNTLLQNLASIIVRTLSFIRRLILPVLLAAASAGLLLWRRARRQSCPPVEHRGECAALFLPPFFAFAGVAAFDAYFGVRYVAHLAPVFVLGAVWLFSLAKRVCRPLSAARVRVAAAAVTVVALLGSFAVKPDWLPAFRGYDTADFAAQTEDAACVFYTDEQADFPTDHSVTSFLPLFLSFEEVYITDSAADVARYDAARPESRLLLCVARGNPRLQEEDVQTFAARLGYDTARELVYSDRYAALWLLSNGDAPPAD